MVRFQLFFGTFDAVVLMASIFILFPRDNAEYVSDALQHFQWAVERFETMSERNRLAAAARGVLHAIHVRLKKALGVGCGAAIPSPTPPALAPTAATNTSNSAGASSASSKETPASSASADPHAGSTAAAGASPSLTSSDTRTSSIFTTPGGGGEQYFGGPPIDPSLSSGGVAPGPAPHAGDEWALPEGFDWGSIQPVYAMADVAYNDLMGISSHGVVETLAGESMPSWAGATPLVGEASGGVAEAGGGADPQGWLFGGDFGSDSVWSVLNQYPAQYGR